MAVPDAKRFATLLRVRKLQQDRRSRELAQVRQLIVHAQNELDQLEREQRHMLSEAGQRARKTFDASDIQRHFQYARYLGDRMDRKSSQITSLRGEEAKRLETLHDAARQRRIAERLDERAAAEYDAFVDRETRKQVDEIAIVRAWTTRGETER